MKRNKITVIAFCLMIAILTVLRIILDETILIGMVVRIIWIISGLLATILAIIHLIKTKK